MAKAPHLGLACSGPLLAVMLAGGPLSSCGSTAAIVAQYLPPSEGADDAFGIAFYGLDDPDLGLYFDIRTTLDDRSPLKGSPAPGDKLERSKEDVGVANVGVTYLFAGDIKRRHGIAAFAGAGYAEFIPIEKFQPGSGDPYWVEGDKDGGFNLNLGFVGWIGHLAFSLGYDSFLERAAFGIGYKF